MIFASHPLSRWNWLVITIHSVSFYIHGTEVSPSMGPRSLVARGRSVQLDCECFLGRIGAQRQDSSAELLSEVQQNAVRPLEVSAPVIVRQSRALCDGPVGREMNQQHTSFDTFKIESFGLSAPSISESKTARKPSLAPLCYIMLEYAAAPRIQVL